MAKLSRRLLLGASASSLMLMSVHSHAVSTRFLTIRVWSGQAYTRVSLESNAKVRYKYFLLDKPARLVVDMENIALNDVLNTIGKKVPSSDPYIRNIRAGQKDSQTVRVVFDLKTNIAPQVFTLEPAAGFNHRLIVDLYPSKSTSADPIRDFWDSTQQKNAQANRNSANNANKNTGNRRRPLVLLDPGHGGEDPGATSAGGLQEKTVVLTIAREAKKRLEEMGYQVRMTRNEDVYISLSKRLEMAKQIQADLFVSIHADSFPNNPSARGTGVYVLSKEGASSEADRLLAERENASDIIGGVKMNSNQQVNNVLIDMVQNQTMNDSARLARLVMNQLSKHNKIRNEIKRANFVVLRSPDVPSILVETAFLSNAQDEALLRSDSFRKKVAQSIADGVKQYLGAAVLARR